MAEGQWLKDTVALTPRGEIEIDARGETLLPGVLAAGDATTVPFKQIVIAVGAGAAPIRGRRGGDRPRRARRPVSAGSGG